jgi:CheY-like chemotaxis protein
MALESIYYCDQDEDDHFLFMDLIKSISPGLSCKPFHNGKNAFLEITRCLPDIIFSEVEIAPYSGLQFLKILKSTKAFKHIPVIIYSSLIDKDEARQYLKAGASEVIKKIYGFTESVKEITRVLTSHCPRLSALRATCRS